MSSSPLVVVLLIDALGWEIVQHFDFAPRLTNRGKLDTIMGYSSSAIPSLLSGCTPVEHGAFTMYRRADGRSPFSWVSHLPPLPHALEWRTRWLVRRLTDRRKLINGYYDLYEIPLRVLGQFDVAHHQDPYAPGGLSCPTLFDWFQEQKVRYRLWYYKSPENQNMNELLAAIPGDDDLLFFYTAELDEMMHIDGIFADTVGTRLQRYEQFIDDIVSGADRAGRECRIVLLSDHGMTNVDRSYDLWTQLTRRGHRLGKDHLAFYDATMARFWQAGSVETDVRELLAESQAGDILSDAEMESAGCLFVDRAYGELICLARPGVMFVPSFMGHAPLKAMHGYHPDDRFSAGCFLSNVPDQRPDSILGAKTAIQKVVAA